MISIELSGKVIFITGAMGAIAEYIVKRLVAAGATLVLVDIKPEDRAEKTLREWQIPASRYVYFSADVTDSHLLNRVVKESFQRFSRMDTALGHAGGCGLHPFANTTEAEYERVGPTNYGGGYGGNEKGGRDQ